MMAARRSPAKASTSVLREAAAISAAALAVFLTLSFFSYVPGAPRANLGGPVGSALADGALHALGVAAYLLPLYLGYLTVVLFRHDAAGFAGTRIAGAALLIASFAALGGLVTGGRAVVRGGGWLGGFVGVATRDLLGGPGATLALTVVLVVAIVLATGVSAVAVAGAVGRGLGTLARRAAAQLRVGAVRLLGRAPARARAGRPARAPVPVLLDDPIEPSEAASNPPPIIREAEPLAPAEPTGPTKRTKRAERQQELFSGESYRLPALALLDPVVRSTPPVEESALIASSRILETKLADFGVIGKVVAVRPGPVITTFEFEPAPGVKVNRIVTLADDLSMALRALSVRVLAPIPGKPVVGIEVSNPRRDKVFIRELLQSEDYQRAESKLTMALGKDTTGNVVVADLARMPHLLVAGATGTGKSVSMNAMLMSVLFKSSPRDVRFIMIDPKMLELSTYENIPHLLVPVVTEPKKAAAALYNTIREMDTRYRLLHDKGVRNIDSYNRLLREAGTDEPEAVEDVPGGGDTLVHRHLPRIVIIIDELADLMLTVGREIEEAITRLAQKARAAGIHLILATQRPSVDVITGLIKANFPARISFQVTSRVDSRTILDAIGAERLLGEGDMLFLPPGTARVQRLHGSFVSDGDVHRVVEFIKGQETPCYQMELLESDEDEAGDGDDAEDMSDEMYDLAVRLVTENRQASISWLQRRLRVGYNRAARMIERMEREGVVAAATGTRPREVIARRIEE